jgi:hypothetical protein
MTGSLEANETTGTGGDTAAGTFYIHAHGDHRFVAFLNCTANTATGGGSGVSIVVNYPQVVGGLQFSYAILRNNAGPSPFAGEPALPWTNPRCCEITGNQVPPAASAANPGLIWLGEVSTQLSGTFEDCVFAGNTYDYFIYCVGGRGLFALTLLRCVLEPGASFTGERITAVATPDAVVLANGPFVLNPADCPTPSPGPTVTLSPVPTPTATDPATDPPETSPPPKRTAAPDPTSSRSFEETTPPDRTTVEVEVGNIEMSAEVIRLPEQTWPPEVEFVAPWKPVRYALVVVGALLALGLAGMETVRLRQVLRDYPSGGERTECDSG